MLFDPGVFVDSSYGSLLRLSSTSRCTVQLTASVSNSPKMIDMIDGDLEAALAFRALLLSRDDSTQLFPRAVAQLSLLAMVEVPSG